MSIIHFFHNVFQKTVPMKHVTMQLNYSFKMYLMLLLCNIWLMVCCVKATHTAWNC